MLGPCVHVGGGFVQDQHGRLHQQGPGNGQKLLLAFGYIGSVVDEERIIALGKAFDVGVDPGRLCRGDHLFPGGIGPPVGDVFVDGAVKEPGVLEDHGVGKPQAFPGDIGNIPAVHQDGAAVDVIKPHQQIDEGGLSGSCGANDGDEAALWGLHAEIL